MMNWLKGSVSKEICGAPSNVLVMWQIMLLTELFQIKVVSFEKIKSAKSSQEAQLAPNKNPKSFYKYIRDSLRGSVRKPQLRDSIGALIPYVH